MERETPNWYLAFSPDKEDILNKPLEIDSGGKVVRVIYTGKEQTMGGYHFTVEHVCGEVVEKRFEMTVHLCMYEVIDLGCNCALNMVVKRGVELRYFELKLLFPASRFPKDISTLDEKRSQLNALAADIIRGGASLNS